MEAPRTAVLLACGDIMLGEHPIMVGWGISRRLDGRDAEYPFRYVRDLLSSADLVLGNLESALAAAPRGRSLSARECLGPARGAVLLRNAGFHALSVANNHIQQHGPQAFRGTLTILRGAGLDPVGVAGDDGRRSLPVDLERDGVQVRLLGYSLRPRQHFTRQPLYAEPDEDSMLADIQAGRDAGRTVVCSIHWGDEFVERPSPEQVRMGRRLVDAGATLILGHHPHVLQGGEQRRDGYIAYSLGNFVFDMIWERRLRRTACLRVRLAPQRVLDAEWVPLWIGDDFAPRPATSGEAAEILHRLGAAAAALPDPSATVPGEAEAAAHAAEVRRELLRHRRASHRHLCRHILRYEPAILMEILGKALRRRLGLLGD